MLKSSAGLKKSPVTSIPELDLQVTDFLLHFASTSLALFPLGSW